MGLRARPRGLLGRGRGRAGEDLHLVDRLCENAPLGLRNAKRALNVALRTPLDKRLEFERVLGRELDDTHSYREGFDARLED